VAVRDRIFVEGIKFHGFHGLTRMEREIGVRLAVDVVVDVDLEGAGREDDVKKTVDYRRVHQRVVEIGRGKSHMLLESFAWTLIRALLKEFGAAERVTVRVRKETPVLDGIVDSIGVEMTRSR
jgi:dihydroneopterin aldolase